MVLVRGSYAGFSVRGQVDEPSRPAASVGPIPGGEQGGSSRMEPLPSYGPGSPASESPSSKTAAPDAPSSPTRQRGHTMLSITEIAKRLGIVESSARSIRDRYPDFVMRRRGPDGNLYSLERFLEISSMQKAGSGRRLATEIRAELARRYPLEASAQTRSQVSFEDARPSASTESAASEAAQQGLVLGELGMVLREEQAQTREALRASLVAILGQESPLAVGLGRLAEQDQSIQRVLERLVQQQAELGEALHHQAEVLTALVELQRLAQEASQLAALPEPQEPPRYSLRWFWHQLVSRPLFGG